MTEAAKLKLFSNFKIKNQNLKILNTPADD
jgi:hypothetical protein